VCDTIDGISVGAYPCIRTSQTVYAKETMGQNRKKQVHVIACFSHYFKETPS